MSDVELYALLIALSLFVVVIPIWLTLRLWICYEGPASSKLWWTFWIMTPFLGIGFYWVAVTDFRRKKRPTDSPTHTP
jgi:hypothetical protein